MRVDKPQGRRAPEQLGQAFPGAAVVLDNRDPDARVRGFAF
jgi:hypothetical protein